MSWKKVSEGTQGICLHSFKADGQHQIDLAVGDVVELQAGIWLFFFSPLAFLDGVHSFFFFHSSSSSLLWILMVRPGSLGSRGSFSSSSSFIQLRPPMTFPSRYLLPFPFFFFFFFFLFQLSPFYQSVLGGTAASWSIRRRFTLSFLFLSFFWYWIPMSWQNQKPGPWNLPSLLHPTQEVLRWPRKPAILYSFFNGFFLLLTGRCHTVLY